MRIEGKSMRSSIPFTIAASLILAVGIQAQSLSEHAAAAAGATIGTAAGKPLSNAITKIFDQVDNSAQKAAKNPSKPLTKTTNEPAPAAVPLPHMGAIVNSDPPVSGGSGQAGSGSRRRTPRSESAANAPVATPTFTIVPVEPPEKQATAEELALIKIGTTEQDLVAMLGRPYSRITIPDEGHMLETYQYRANGKPLATIRLDNGQVVTIEPIGQN
jgi:hypothetical protein